MTVDEIPALRPIGSVRSPFRTTREIPLQGGPAALEILPEFSDALDGIEGSSHLLVMGFLHRADRTALRTRPVKIDPTAPERGVFATRSPARPNPVSLTVVPLLARDGLRLEVDGLDLVDGTPLVDVKPYAPGWDSVFCAHHAHRRPRAALGDGLFVTYLERDLHNFMGDSARDEAARWGLAATLVGTRALGVDPRDRSLRIRVNRADATAEALMALTGAALFNGRLAIAPDDDPLRIRFEHGGRSAELVRDREELPAGAGAWAGAFAIATAGG